MNIRYVCARVDECGAHAYLRGFYRCPIHGWVIRFREDAVEAARLVRP